MVASFLRKHTLFILLIPIIIYSQITLLEPHLKYGFSDVDWGFLSVYKTQNPYSLSQFVQNLKSVGTLGGVYTHQIYYIGIQGDLFNLNYEYFQQTTHFFRILAIIFSYFIFLAVSRSKWIAFLSTIIFGISYSAIGTMYTVVTSSDYLALWSMEIFILFYWYIIQKNITNMGLLLISLLLLLLTLFLSTERMYSLPLFIILIEVFLIFQKISSKKVAIKRVVILLSPLFLIFILQPVVFLDFFLGNGALIYKGVISGDWNLLLTPFIALGSIIIPPDYTKFLGVINLKSFGQFIDSFISGPFLILTTVSTLIGLILNKRFLSISIQILIFTFIFCLFLFITGSHFKSHLITVQALMQALIGGYILLVSYVSFKLWIKTKEHLLIGLFVGPFFAFIYIFLTWLAAAPGEVFSGAHRYLTIPALMMSLFVGTLFVRAFLKLVNFFKTFKYLQVLSFIIFIPLLLFININIKEIRTFFHYHLYSGFGAEDKDMMRDQLLSYLNNLSNTKRSLFYFDFSDDQINGYYYDNTLLGGFQSWMLWHPSINFETSIAPYSFWNQPKELPKFISEREGVKGLFYREEFFPLENFYAFKLKNKEVINIKDDLLK